MRVNLRQELKQFISMRPIKILRGIHSPLRTIERTNLDWVIIGENSEGEYSGQGGVTHPKAAYGIATEVTVFTRHATERTFRFAFETAQGRPRKKLTMVTKSNMQRWGMVFCESHVLYLLLPPFFS
jgi:isocitrate/isopropylmalate dehydrogenase